MALGVASCSINLPTTRVTPRTLTDRQVIYSSYLIERERVSVGGGVGDIPLYPPSLRPPSTFSLTVPLSLFSLDVTSLLVWLVGWVGEGDAFPRPAQYQTVSARATPPLHLTLCLVPPWRSREAPVYERAFCEEREFDTWCEGVCVGDAEQCRFESLVDSFGPTELKNLMLRRVC